VAATDMAAAPESRAGYADDADSTISFRRGRPKDGNLLARLSRLRPKVVPRQDGGDPSAPHIDGVEARRDDWGACDPSSCREGGSFYSARGTPATTSHAASSRITPDGMVRTK